MKKISLPISISFVLIVLGCQKPPAIHVYKWKKGDSNKVLVEVSHFEEETPPNAKLVKAANEQIKIQSQSYRKIPIVDSFIKSIYDDTNEKIWLTAAINPQIETLKKLPFQRFAQRQSNIVSEIKNRIPLLKKNKVEKVDIIIEASNLMPELLWRVEYFDTAEQAWEMRLNEDLQLKSIHRVGSQFHDTLALVFPRGPKASPLQEVTLKNLKLLPNLSNEALIVQSQASEVISESSGLKFNPDDTRFDQVQVFYFLSESLSWFKSKLGFDLPMQLQAEVHVGAPDKTNTAFYYQGKIRIGSGDSISYQKIPQDPSIVIHESVHALVESIARLPYEGEGGSINEAYADFFTALQLDNPKMGEVAWLKGPFRRTIDSEKTLAEKTGGLYGDSAIVSGTLWEIRKKFGSEKAKNIAILTLNRLNPMSDFQDFGIQLKESLTMVLSAEEQQEAMTILKKRGFE